MKTKAPHALSEAETLRRIRFLIPNYDQLDNTLDIHGVAKVIGIPAGTIMADRYRKRRFVEQGLTFEKRGQRVVYYKRIVGEWAIKNTSHKFDGGGE